MSSSASPTAMPVSRPPHRNRSLLVVAIAILVIAGVAAGGYGLWYILIGPSSPAAVSAASPIVPGGAGIAAPASFDGTWNVNTSLGTIDEATASFAGYRVQEQLVGVGGHTAVGRTTKLSGSMVLAGAVVEDVQVTADLTALRSDSDQRDGQLQRQAIETDAFPTATFRLAMPIDLGTLPANGTQVGVNARGAFTLHGVTRTVTIALQAVRQGGVIAVAGTLPIVFSDYSIQKPSSFSIVSVDDHGIMEFHLLFTHA